MVENYRVTSISLNEQNLATMQFYSSPNNNNKGLREDGKITEKVSRTVITTNDYCEALFPYLNIFPNLPSFKQVNSV